MYILQRKQHYFSEIMGNCNEVVQLLNIRNQQKQR